MAAIRARAGLDLPWHTQLLHYRERLAHFDLRRSARFGVPVSSLILERLPNMLLLMAASFTLALVLGVFAGVVMGANARKLPDRVLQVLVLVFYSTPASGWASWQSFTRT